MKQQYVGLDVSLEQTSICVIDDAGTVLWRGKCRSTPESIHAVIEKQAPQQIVDQVLAMPEGSRFQVLAPVVRTRKGEFVDLFAALQAQGYSRVLVDGTVYPLTEAPKLKKQDKHDISVVVDRLSVKDSAKQRLTDSVETALRLAEGVLVLDFVDLDEHDPDRERRFSEKMACPNGHQLAVDDLEPRAFSSN